MAALIRQSQTEDEGEGEPEFVLAELEYFNETPHPHPPTNSQMVSTVIFSYGVQIAVILWMLLVLLPPLSLPAVAQVPAVFLWTLAEFRRWQFLGHLCHSQS